MMNAIRYCVECHFSSSNLTKCCLCTKPLRKYSVGGLIRKIKYYYKTGKEFGYPTCCIIKFCWYEILDNYLGLPIKRKFSEGYPTVKCSYHYRRTIKK